MTNPQQVSVAIANTGSFQFIATGATEEQAVDALLEAWRTHAAETGAVPGYLDSDDVNVMTGPLGQAFRDYSPYPRGEVLPPAPDGAGLCERCGHWDTEPNKHLRCPSCGRPWDAIVGDR